MSTYTLQEIFGMPGKISMVRPGFVVRQHSKTVNYYREIKPNRYINYDCRTVYRTIF